MILCHPYSEDPGSFCNYLHKILNYLIGWVVSGWVEYFCFWWINTEMLKNYPVICHVAQTVI